MKPGGALLRAMFGKELQTCVTAAALEVQRCTASCAGRRLQHMAVGIVGYATCICSKCEAAQPRTLSAHVSSHVCSCTSNNSALASPSVWVSVWPVGLSVCLGPAAGHDYKYFTSLHLQQTPSLQSLHADHPLEHTCPNVFFASLLYKPHKMKMHCTIMIIWSDWSQDNDGIRVHFRWQPSRQGHQS